MATTSSPKYTFSRRRDPEDIVLMEWMWRRLFVLSRCMEVPEKGSWQSEKAEWYIDASYCLDRWSHIDFPARS